MRWHPALPSSLLMLIQPQWETAPICLLLLHRATVEKKRTEPELAAANVAEARDTLSPVAPFPHATEGGGSMHVAVLPSTPVGESVVSPDAAAVDLQLVSPASVSGAPQPALWLGDAEVHRTHTLRHYSDMMLWVCTKCGLYAAMAARDLARPCGVLTDRGRRNLAAIERGDWPQFSGMPAEVSRCIELRRTVT